MNNSAKQNLIPLIVIIGGSVLLLISFGIRHSMGLYLLPVSNYLSVGRELFGFSAALQVLMIGIGSPLFGALSDKYGITTYNKDGSVSTVPSTPGLQRAATDKPWWVIW